MANIGKKQKQSAKTKKKMSANAPARSGTKNTGEVCVFGEVLPARLLYCCDEECCCIL